MRVNVVEWPHKGTITGVKYSKLSTSVSNHAYRSAAH